VLHSTCAEEFQTFKKTLRYKQLLDEGFKITFKLKNMISECSSVDTPLNFIDILHQKIKDEQDPDLESIFSKFVTQ
jgi:hypothetical protein